MACLAGGTPAGAAGAGDPAGHLKQRRMLSTNSNSDSSQRGVNVQGRHDAPVADVPQACSAAPVPIRPARVPPALRLLGVLAVFAFSGLEHEVLFWYVTRRLPLRWGVFFAVHGFLVACENVAETVMRKRRLRHQHRLSTIRELSASGSSGFALDQQLAAGQSAAQSMEQSAGQSMASS